MPANSYIPQHHLRGPKIIIIAGPNGAGKTTFAREFLPKEARCWQFINVNLLAQGLSPFAPDTVAAAARRLMGRVIRDQVRQRRSFAIETTFSNLTYARRVPAWRKLGYRVELYFLSLAVPELSVARVSTRARQGGHTLSEAEIRHRFAVGLQHFKTHFQSVVNTWMWFDNSGPQPELIAMGGDNRHDVVPGGALLALRRAGKKVRQLARQTHTPVHILLNGRIREESDCLSAETWRVA
jgi:predicted ABC-type ATPase